MSNQKEITELLNRFTKEFAALTDDNMTSCKIFINCEGFEADFKWHYADRLKKRGISMRNIKGEFIK